MSDEQGYNVQLESDSPEDDEEEFEESPPLSAGDIRRLYDEAVQDQAAAHYEYWLNHAYLLNEQNAYWNRVTGQVEMREPDDDRLMATVNHMLPMSRSIISKLNSRDLKFQVLPTAADDATIRAARISESVARSLHRQHRWEEIREDVSWAAWKGGTAAISVEWDPSKGSPVGVSDTGRSFGTGDSVETALSIVDFVVEPGTRDPETSARWWIKGTAHPPEEVQARFRLAKKPAADATAGLSPFHRKLMASHAGGNSTTLRDNADLTLVLTYYERPNDLRPEGAVINVVENKIVSESEWPFTFKDRLNLTIFHETRVDGQWLGMTVLSAARSIQNAINQSWSSIIEHMKNAGNARLLVPQSAIEFAQTLTDTPGEVVPWPDGVQAPAWSGPPQMPSWWIEEPDRLKIEMEDVLGLHDVSRGRAPSNIESGLGLSILAEQDATPIGRMVKEAAGAWGRIASMVLSLYEDKVKETRESVVRIPGRMPETIRWTGGHLRKQTTAEVPPDAIIPRSRAQQLEFAREAATMGLLDNPRALARFVKLADIPDMADALVGLAPDVEKARRENYEMTLGQVTIPEDFDDHNIHVEEHLTEMKGPGWNLLKPEVQDIFRKHVQAHSVLSAEQLAKQQAKAEVSPVLASAADPTGAPALPVEATGPILEPQGPPPEAVEGVQQDVEGAVGAAFPGIDPSIIQAGI